MDKGAKIYVAGHNGLVGKALCRKLEADGYTQILKASRAEVDLCNQKATQEFFEAEKPEYVFLAAARVGGIHINRVQPADFIYDNLAISLNAVECSRQVGVKKLIYLGSSCIYPKHTEQPIHEDALLTGALESTNHCYALAKIAGLKMCAAYNRQHGTNFLTVMPTNLYGPEDNFDLETSHVLPALLRKCHEAKVAGEPELSIWGSGTPRREFLHVDDLADACVYLMNTKNASDLNGHVNIGVGEDLSIRDLAELIQKVVGFEGQLTFDTSMPDGTPRKLLNVDKMNNLGWKATRDLESGIADTYAWYLKNLPTRKDAS